MFRIFLSILFFSFSLHIQASSRWTLHKIPGAYCGDGSEYHVYVTKGHSRKVAVGFEGGGACWNYSTCFGPMKLTSLSLSKSNPVNDGILSPESPINDFMVLYIPYCTGDVHTGQHLARYSGKTVNHFGKENVERVIEYVTQQNIIKWESLQNIMVYGHSAGAIGALLHVATIDPLVTNAESKILTHR